MCTKSLSSLKVQENWLCIIQWFVEVGGRLSDFGDFLVSVLLLVEISLQNHG